MVRIGPSRIGISWRIWLMLRIQVSYSIIALYLFRIKPRIIFASSGKWFFLYSSNALNCAHIAWIIHLIVVYFSHLNIKMSSPVSIMKVNVTLHMSTNALTIFARVGFILWNLALIGVPPTDFCWFLVLNERVGILPRQKNLHFVGYSCYSNPIYYYFGRGSNFDFC